MMNYVKLDLITLLVYKTQDDALVMLGERTLTLLLEDSISGAIGKY